MTTLLEPPTILAIGKPPFTPEGDRAAPQGEPAETGTKGGDTEEETKEEI